jgi:branched-chain amino acid transport system permease protein
MSSSLLLGAIFTGLVFGSIYALIGVSFNIGYRPTNVFNFAQGSVVMIGGLMSYTVLVAHGLPWLAAVPIVFAVGAVIGYLEERLAVRPILDRSQTSAAWVITTLAVTLILDSLVAWRYPQGVYNVDPPHPLSLDAHDILSVPVSSYQVALIVITIAIVALAEIVYGSRAGRAIRAVAEDREGATMRGIDSRRLGAASFAVSLGVAAVAGLLAAPILLASTSLSQTFLIFGFQAAAVGGVGNNKGTLVAGWLIGIIASVGAVYLNPTAGQAFTLLALLLILVIRPAGIFGQQEVRRV